MYEKTPGHLDAKPERNGIINFFEAT